MKKNKLSDDKIIKALECCLNRELYCDECPLHDKHYPCLCANKLKEESIDLIHRLQAESAKQNAEIERLKLENKANIEAWDIKEDSYKEQLAELQKQVDKAWFEVGKMCMEERKDTAKEILQELYMNFSADYLLGMMNKYKDWKYADFIKEYAKARCVEVE